MTARGYLDESYQYPDFRGATLLHHVAGDPMRVELRTDVVGMTQVLLDAGADVNAATIEGATTFTLIVAAEQPNWLGVDEELIHMLMAAGADPNARRGYSM